jgi:hypothetical protein
MYQSIHKELVHLRSWDRYDYSHWSIESNQAKFSPVACLRLIITDCIPKVRWFNPHTHKRARVCVVLSTSTSLSYLIYISRHQMPFVDLIASTAVQSTYHSPIALSYIFFSSQTHTLKAPKDPFFDVIHPTTTCIILWWVNYEQKPVRSLCNHPQVKTDWK